MKASLLYLMIGLATIVAQTTVLGLPVFHGAVSDLLIPLIVFLSLERPNRQGVSLALALGLVMDLVSGGIFGLYLSIYFLSVIVFGLFGHDIITSLTAVGANIGNIGPGLGKVGPAENYNFFADPLKWLCVFNMLAGRLEIYSVIIILIPEYWRR